MNSARGLSPHSPVQLGNPLLLAGVLSPNSPDVLTPAKRGTVVALRPGARSAPPHHHLATGRAAVEVPEPGCTPLHRNSDSNHPSPVGARRAVPLQRSPPTARSFGRPPGFSGHLPAHPGSQRVFTEFASRRLQRDNLQLPWFRQ